MNGLMILMSLILIPIAFHLFIIKMAVTCNKASWRFKWDVHLYFIWKEWTIYKHSWDETHYPMLSINNYLYGPNDEDGLIKTIVQTSVWITLLVFVYSVLGLTWAAHMTAAVIELGFYFARPNLTRQEMPDVFWYKAISQFTQRVLIPGLRKITLRLRKITLLYWPIKKIVGWFGLDLDTVQ